MQLTLAQVVEQHAPAYLAAYAARMPPWHIQALGRIRACGTEEAGRVFYQCPQCDDWRMAPASCGHRACNACGHGKALAWEAKQKARLLPVAYVLVTFTLPAEFRGLFRANQEICYDLFFQESAATLREIAADPKHLGGEIGMTGVLHTWTRDLRYHPHIHYIVPAGAWASGQWIDPKRMKQGETFFLPVKVLATRMRNRLMQRLRREHRQLLRHLPVGAWRKRWNVDARPVGRGDTALGYLARYVQKTALDASRLVANDAPGVTIGWTERKSGTKRTAKLTGSEFLRRFLQHVLPTGFTRVRHFGFLSAAAKKTYAAVKATLAGGDGQADQAVDPGPAPTGQPPDPGPETTNPPSKHSCPRCQVLMEFREFWPAHQPGSGPPGYQLRPGQAIQRPLPLVFSSA